jgi:ABC-type sugar transport system ATPase subunit
MGDVLLAASGIRKTYTAVTALDNVGIELRAGEIHAVMGENGSGKSTLLSILSGAQAPDAGTISIQGTDYAALDPKFARKLRIEFVPQEPQLAPALTVAENLFLGRLPGKGPLLQWRKLQADAQRMIDDLGFGLDARALVSSLSTGRRQLVELAKALVEKPDVLLLDEATSSLDEPDVMLLFALLQKLKQRGVAIAFVSHRMKEVMSLADRITVLRDGRYIGSGFTGQVNERQLIAMMVGRNIETFWHKADAEKKEILLEMKQVSRGPLRDISLHVRAGEIVGLAGLVGSGRSATMRTLMGVKPSREGVISVRGEPRRIDNPRAAHGLGLAYVPEDRKAEGLVMAWPIFRNVSLSIMNGRSPLSILTSAYDAQALARGARGLSIRSTGPNQVVQQLSGGNQQKVVIARELATEPTVILLDEPTRGVDVGAKEDIYKQMAELVQRGVGILMASSELPELLGVCDRIYVLFRGRIVAELDAKEATEEGIAYWASGVHELNKSETEVRHAS